MTVPNYQMLMLPLLKLTTDQKNHQFRKIVENLAYEFNLTEEDRKAKLPCGSVRLFDNRVGWARFYLVRARLLKPTKRGFVKITKRGMDLISENPKEIGEKLLSRYPDFKVRKSDRR